MARLKGMQERYGVIALGGNAILRKGQTADPYNQMANLRVAIDNLEPALDRYRSFALSHGNGPQAGYDLLRSYHANRNEDLAELGLADIVANTQGRIGHWIIREMKNHPDFRNQPVACVLTHVYVGKNEFTPDEYTKYVGPWRPNTLEIREKLDNRGIVYKIPESDPEKLRQVVPSPKPTGINEFRTIAGLLEHGTLTICCGGGGIPVFDPWHGEDRDNLSIDRFEQAHVVVDKDRASALLASRLLSRFDDADVELIILMDANGLYRDSRLREEDFIEKMTLAELEEFLKAGTLEKGSIKPKLEAIADFLRAGGRRAFLGPLENFRKIFDPHEPTGTTFVSSEQLGLYD